MRAQFFSALSSHNIYGWNKLQTMSKIQ